MSKHALPALAAATFAVLSGCTCADTTAPIERYICRNNLECADGYFCDPSGECIKNGGAMGGGVGGGGVGGGGAGGGGAGGGGAGGGGGDGGGLAGGAGGGDPDGGPGGGGGSGGGSAGGGGGASGGMGGGGGAAGGGGAGGGGVVDAGFLQFVFTSAAQTIPVGTCSAAVNFEVRNGGVPTGVAGGTVVTLSAAPSGVLGLFRGTGCTTAGPITMAPDASTGTFSFFANDGGPHTLTLSATGIASASQAANATYPPATSLVFLGTAQTQRAGDCSTAIQVELRDAANNPAKASVSTAVLLTSAPAPGVVFYSDLNCNTVITQATIPVGASRATFYVERATGQPYTLTASAGLLTANRVHTVLPVVRAGTCTIGDTDGGVTCPVSPPVLSLTDSFLIYQVASASAESGAVAVRCDLDTLSSITCRRLVFVGDAFIAWQVAEVTGATVRKVESWCDGGFSNVALGAVAPPLSSFVLTANENDGNVLNDSDLNVARLTDGGTSVDFFFGASCTGPQSMLAQVVTLPGLVVSRQATNLAAAAATRSIADPPPPTQGVLLAQWTTPSGAAGICDRALRTELQGNSQVFSRANGSAAAFCTATAVPAISYERVDFRTTATVQQVPVTLAAGATMTTTTVTAVDRTRTLVFTGSHSSMGMGLGEGQHQGTTNTTDFWGDVAGSFNLPGTGYQATSFITRRASSQGNSRWTVWVVELIP